MWQKKHEVVDTRTGMHVITLHEPESGAQHKLQIIIGPQSCPHCGHIVAVRTEDGDMNVAQHVANELASLNENHAAMKAHAERNRVPVRKFLK